MNRMQSIGGTKIKSKFDMRIIISYKFLDLLMQSSPWCNQQITEVDDARHISGLIGKMCWHFEVS